MEIEYKHGKKIIHIPEGYSEEFLNEVKTGDMINTISLGIGGGVIWVWIDEVDRPQKPKENE